jgi:hypothetical protein
MDEIKSIAKIRNSFDEYIERTEKEILELREKNTFIVHKLAFYLFEYHLVKGSLSDKLKCIFDSRNTKSTRLKEIMDLKDKELTYEQLPVEIKIIIEDVIL